MKKKLLIGILSLGLLLPFGVSAETIDSETLDSVEEGSNSTNASVTVGDVAVTTYEVAIVWNDLTFDWVYNYDTRKFEWAPAQQCNYFSNSQEDVENAILTGETLYTDTNCTTSKGEYEEETTYYSLVRPEVAGILIEDMSENGQITPSIAWESDEKYSDVTAQFQYTGKTCVAIETQEVYDIAKERTMYSDSECSNELTSVPEFAAGQYYVYAYKTLDLTTEEIPDTGRMTGAGGSSSDELIFPIEDARAHMYGITLRLLGGATTPTTGDTIGTITIKIKAAE